MGLPRVARSSRPWAGGWVPVGDFLRMGSDVKARKLRGEMEAAGISREVVGELRCPLRLPIGGNAPAEIAISIAAQLLMERDAGNRGIPVGEDTTPMGLDVS